MRAKIIDIKQNFPKHETNFDSLKTELGKANDFDTLKDLIDEITKEKDVIRAIFTETKGVDQKVGEIKEQMGDCLIPVNIAKRAKEISQF